MYAVYSDGTTERRAAESSEQNETRLARRRVADMSTEQCVFLILYILWYIVHVYN